MLNQMSTKRHYKMYKKGKHWLFASVIATSLALGAVDVTANADTTADEATPVTTETDETQSQLQDKRVSLTPTPAKPAADESDTPEPVVTTAEPETQEPATVGSVKDGKPAKPENGGEKWHSRRPLWKLLSLPLE